MEVHFALVMAYAKAVGTYWLAVVTGILLVAADVSKKIVPSWKVWADRIGFTEARRRAVELTFLVLAILWAGYAAWDDEHSALLKAEAARQGAAWWAAYWKGQATAKNVAVIAPAEAPRSKSINERPLPSIDPDRPILDEDYIGATYPQQYSPDNSDYMTSRISIRMINSGIKSAHMMESYCATLFGGEAPQAQLRAGQVPPQKTQTLGEILDPHTARVQSGRDSWNTPTFALQCDPSGPLSKSQFDEFSEKHTNFYGLGYIKYSDENGNIYIKYFAVVVDFENGAKLFGESRFNYIACIPTTACPKQAEH